MKIEHIAIWVKDLEKTKAFYTEYFGMNCSNKYLNTKKGFSSYFLSFEESSRIEIMHRDDIQASNEDATMVFGFTHLAISVGNAQKVDDLTDQLRANGYTIAGEPRTTGDGYYESVVLDPEGNAVEITE